MITTIGKIITGALFFGMRSCEYLTTPKGGSKLKCILQKGDIIFYIKCREFTHNINQIDLADKVYPIFSTHNNGVNNVTVTQWRTVKSLLPVQIWTDIISRLDSYPVRLDNTPVNTVWVENHKTTIIYQMAIKFLIY